MCAPREFSPRFITDNEFALSRSTVIITERLEFPRIIPVLYRAILYYAWYTIGSPPVRASSSTRLRRGRLRTRLCEFLDTFSISCSKSFAANKSAGAKPIRGPIYAISTLAIKRVSDFLREVSRNPISRDISRINRARRSAKRERDLSREDIESGFSIDVEEEKRLMRRNHGSRVQGIST